MQPQPALKAALLLALAALAGCQGFAPLPPPVARTSIPPPAPAPAPRPTRDSAPAPSEIPPDLASIPDATPVDEPPSRGGNPDRYEALGEQYTVLKEPPRRGYFESGKASWYGKQFHGRKTANGEIYNMFAMTAAHKTLRLPSYARVTNLANGKSCVVKINDRGPFIKGRIIDLSYAAATKLDILKSGHADVTLEVLTPDLIGGGMSVPDTAPRYLELGRFADPVDAAATNGQLANLDLPGAEFLQVGTAEGDSVLHILRVGPFEDFASLEKARLKLQKKGITASPAFD